MRIRLNTKADELWIELAGANGKVDGGALGEPMRSIEVPGEHGRAAFIEIDQDGYVRMVRVARLQDIIDEFSPKTSAATKGKGQKT
jgi:uncharacterized protein YuzE